MEETVEENRKNLKLTGKGKVKEEREKKNGER